MKPWNMHRVGGTRICYFGRVLNSIDVYKRNRDR
jgi:hypothetical protein